jgi:lipoprotein-releasing system permease protein
MAFPLELALRYLRSRRRAFISVSTVFAILGVALGTAALVAVMSVTGGFRAQFREKVVGVNAHVLVLKYAGEFRDYRDVIRKVEKLPGVVGVNPFAINPMMVTHGDRTATGVMVKGIDPARVGQVLDLPQHIVEGSLDGLRVPGNPPPSPAKDDAEDELDLSEAEIEATSEPREPAGDLLEAIRRTVDAGAPRPGASAAAHEDVATYVPSPGDLPSGSIVPQGGYQSELPGDDVLPEEIDPDPCSNPSSTLPGIVLGSTLKQNLHAKLGDCIQITSPTIGYSYVRGTLRPPVARQFRVTGVFHAGFDQYDAKFVYVDLPEAQAFYSGGDTVTGVEMKLDDLERSHEVVKEVERALDSEIYNVLDWEELNHGLFTALQIQQILMSLVLALIILVAAFTVIATLIMVVLDKKREIATLKAMGASDGQLMKAFLYQGLIIGLIGASSGLAFGYAVCRWILIYGFPLDPKVYFISRLPVQIRPESFVLTGVFAVAMCLAATVWPALYAARLRPAEAFREL